MRSQNNLGIATDQIQFRREEIAVRMHRAEAGGMHQDVLVPRRHVEAIRQLHHDGGVRRGPPGLERAKVLEGNARFIGQVGLAHAAESAPLAQQPAKTLS